LLHVGGAVIELESSSSTRKRRYGYHNLSTDPRALFDVPEMSRKDLEALGSQRESLSTNPLLMKVGRGEK